MSSTSMADDRGIVSVWTAVTVASLILFAGFLVDGIGVVLRARGEAFSVAAAAARAGAQMLDDGAAVRGQVLIDPVRAQEEATRYLAARDVTGTVAVNGERVTVTVSEVADLSVLPGSVTINATATVAALEGGGP